MNDETKGMLLGVAGVSCFGLTLPITRVFVPYMDPVFIGLGRAVLAALVGGLLLLLFKERIPAKSTWLPLVIVALGVVVGFPVLSSWGMQYVPASHGGVVLALLPLATAVMATFVTDEKPSPLFWVAGLLGSGFVLAYALISGAGSFGVGDIALLAAVLSAAVGYAVGAKLSKTLGGWQVICWALLLSLPFITWPAINAAPADFSSLPSDVIIGFLYLSLVSQLSGFFLWYKGLALGGVARVSQAQLLQPIVTILASVWFVGEKLDMATVIFAGLVIATVGVSRKAKVYSVARA
ncbi:MAG: DMT family transporter [Kordiimonadaceae bacterium]|nr:DMT family transporter [Kordiimonadaceae bacterium]